MKWIAIILLIMLATYLLGNHYMKQEKRRGSFVYSKTSYYLDTLFAVLIIALVIGIATVGLLCFLNDMK